LNINKVISIYNSDVCLNNHAFDLPGTEILETPIKCPEKICTYYLRKATAPQTDNKASHDVNKELGKT
jgi:hypothetical protein